MGDIGAVLSYGCQVVTQYVAVARKFAGANVVSQYTFLSLCIAMYMPHKLDAFFSGRQTVEGEPRPRYKCE